MFGSKKEKATEYPPVENTCSRTTLPPPQLTALSVLKDEREKLIEQLNEVRQARAKAYEHYNQLESTLNEKLHALTVDIVHLEIHPEIDRIMRHVMQNPALKLERQ
jgi:hypothetical protein